MLKAMKVATREVGTLPLSIGTALAIEQLLTTPKEWADELWINIRTVVRNIVSALPSAELRNSLVGHDVYPTLSGELSFLMEHIANETKGRTKVFFYFCSYEDLRIKFPAAILKEPKTQNQLDALALETSILNELFAQNQVAITKFKTDIRATRSNAIMMTHLPVDLLSYVNFNKLRLLESHTGNLKSKDAWGSKLTDGKNLPRIPFNAFTIQVFGDNNNHFASLPISIKKIVVELADQRKWTNVSSIELIESHIRTITDPAVKLLLTKMIRA